MRDALPGTSLLQSWPEIDHRDQHNHQHLHKHEHLHPRQQADLLITSIVSTVSVVQEIIVDQNGSTVQLKTTLVASPAPPIDPTNIPPPTDASVSMPPMILEGPAASAPTTPILILDIPTAPAALVGSKTPNAPLSVNTNPPVPLAATPFLAINSSVPTVSASSSFTSLTNVTALSSTLTSKTGSTLTPSSTSSEAITSTSDELSSSTFISITSDFYFSSDLATATGGFDPGATAGGGGGLGGGAGATTATRSTTAATTTTTGDAGGTTDAGQSTPTPVVVGGVVGAVAGIVFIIALVMVLVRWRKRKQSLLPLGSSDSHGGEPSAGEGLGGSSGGREMTRRTSVFAVPAALASLVGHKRTSHQRSMDHSSTAGSEQGFYRVSGRKLPSVLQHGGDGYGGGHESLAASSFYRDSQGPQDGLRSPTSPLLNRESGIPISRPSPARTPVISESGFAPPSPIPTSPAPSPILSTRRPDLIGRTHPSRDGSRGSKFTEQV